MLWDNIERLEELAREIVTAPADDVEKASPDDDSLYKGSKVLYSRKTPSKAFEASPQPSPDHPWKGPTFHYGNDTQKMLKEARRRVVKRHKPIFLCN